MTHGCYKQAYGNQYLLILFISKKANNLILEHLVTGFQLQLAQTIICDRAILSLVINLNVVN